jgi:hypothetical protein
MYLNTAQLFACFLLHPRVKFSSEDRIGLHNCHKMVGRGDSYPYSKVWADSVDIRLHSFFEIQPLSFYVVRVLVTERHLNVR